jgi:hypothetical protein
LIILLAAAGLAALGTRWRWTTIVGVIVPAFLLVGATLAPQTRDHLGDPGQVGIFIGTAIQPLALGPRLGRRRHPHQAALPVYGRGMSTTLASLAVIVIHHLGYRGLPPPGHPRHGDGRLWTAEPGRSADGKPAGGRGGHVIMHMAANTHGVELAPYPTGVVPMIPYRTAAATSQDAHAGEVGTPGCDRQTRQLASRRHPEGDKLTVRPADTCQPGQRSRQVQPLARQPDQL